VIPSARGEVVGLGCDLQAIVADRLHACGCVFAEEEALLLVDAASSAASPAAELSALVDRRVAGEPLEHILRWVEFCGLRISIEPGVFVPRRRTELLVELAAARIRPGDLVVDLCCGSGAVGLAVAARCPRIRLYAADIDPVAVRCAAGNLADIGGRVCCGDLFDALPPELMGAIDLLVVNAPYVPTEALGLLPPEARNHEPRWALDGGDDGLDIHRRVAADASHWLAASGCLVMETSPRQRRQTAAVARRSNLRTRIVESTDLGATAVVARR
jgi:release factor glutamine methyltransferase